MIEATRILFLPVVQDSDRRQSEDDLTALQNEGYTIASVCAWSMGQVCVVLTRGEIGLAHALTYAFDKSVDNVETAIDQSSAKSAKLARVNTRSHKPRTKAKA